MRKTNQEGEHPNNRKKLEMTSEMSIRTAYQVSYVTHSLVCEFTIRVVPSVFTECGPLYDKLQLCYEITAEIK